MIYCVKKKNDAENNMAVATADSKKYTTHHCKIINI